MDACPLPGTMPVICGIVGAVASVNGALASDTGLVPTSLVAVARQAYVSPFVSPEIVMGDVGLVLPNPRRLALTHKTVYSVIGEPPSSATLTLTEACPLLVIMPVNSGAEGARGGEHSIGSVTIVVEPLLKPCGQPVVPSQ
jgi:hypothetical protein